MPQSKLRLSFVRVHTWDQAVDLMAIRNECRQGMTHNQEIITVEQQLDFYNVHLNPTTGDGIYECYLLMHKNRPIGYGLLKWDQELDHYWMTAGLIKDFRGRGLSRFLIGYISEMGAREGSEVWIDVWENNLALIGDIKVGYRVMKQITEGVNGRILNVMKYDPDLYIKNEERAILDRFKQQRNTIKMTTEIEEVDKISRESYK